jgi:hypothetical protein
VGGPASQCPSGATCQASSKCATATCSAATNAITTTPCTAQCRSTTPSLISATFSNSGDSILVRLSAAAYLDESAGCAALLLPSSLKLLGSFSSCTASGTTLTISPSPDATIKPGDVLQLNTKQAALKDVSSGTAFTGRTTVATCTACMAPRALISGPPVISNPCSDASDAAKVAAAAVFDGTQSRSQSGRSLKSAVWKLLGRTAKEPVLASAVAVANAQSDVR